MQFPGADLNDLLLSSLQHGGLGLPSKILSYAHIILCVVYTIIAGIDDHIFKLAFSSSNPNSKG